MRIRARYRGFSLKYLKIDWPQKKKKKELKTHRKTCETHNTWTLSWDDAPQAVPHPPL